MELLLKEKIVLQTPHGTSEVQFLFGDITSLPLEQKVDYIFVSAFPGDYTEVPGTLIGALKRNLNLRVRDYAKEKEVNLLQTFNCWVSRPLPEEMPYGRIVCFERMNRLEKVAEQISGMFRAMMPVFNNHDTTVITPLLASGNQGHSEDMVLRSIVKAACHWIKAGLPLRCLKVVLYKRDPHAVSEDQKQLLKSFIDLKQRWESKKAVQVEKKGKTYDVCLSFSARDEDLAKSICDEFQKVDTKIRIYSQHFQYNHDEVWQEAIFQTMVHSQKIVAILTPNYTSDSECLEQFSLALCCNRLEKAEVLAPFYLQTIDAFPSYMTLVQYTECRVRKEGEVAEKKIFVACTILVKSLDKTAMQQQDYQLPAIQGSTVEEPEIVSEKKYDIFISYAHRTPTEANLLYDALQLLALNLNPDLKIFIDKSELQMGNIWQETLYEAVDRARCVIALITESYMASTVCQEEYNIALARFFAGDGICFIPMLVDSKIKEIPAPFASTPIIDLRESDGRFMEYYHVLAEKVLSIMETGNATPFYQPPRRVRVEAVRETWRKRDFNDRFELEVPEDNNWTIRLKNPPVLPSTGGEKPARTVAFSFAKDCFSYTMTLSTLLSQQENVNIKSEFLISTEMKPPKLQLLDSADMVIVFMSDEYMTSMQHRHELHIALCRQRTTKDRQVVYLIQANHVYLASVYPFLLHHRVNLGDRIWTVLGHQRRIPQKKKAIRAMLPSGEEMTVFCTREEMLALTTASVDISNILAVGPTSEGSGMPTNIVNLQELLLDITKKDRKEKVPVEKCTLVPFTAMKDAEQLAAVKAPAPEDPSNPEETSAAPSAPSARQPPAANLQEPRTTLARNQKGSSSCSLL